jgi:TonB family protein
MLVSKVEPEYTPDATQAGVEGRVVMRVTVDAAGMPADVKVQSVQQLSNGGWGPGAALVDNAIAAVKQWRFQPQILNGTARTYSLTVRTDFQLSGVASAVLDPPVAATVPRKAQ